MSEISNANKQSGLPQISKKFTQENQTHKINVRKKGGPYSKADRQIRRKEVYRLHFEFGYSALKISELMKINRNTINGDIQYWYSKVVKNWNDSSPKFFVVRNVERLELQRTRLVEEHIPNWIKNTAGWWSEGVITEGDFVSGIKWLVENGIIRI